MNDIFKFEKDDLLHFIEHNMSLFKKVEKPLDYIFEILDKLGHSITLDSLEDIDINKVEILEGKNYNWCVVKYDNIQLLIRVYRRHLTIWSRIPQHDQLWEEDVYEICGFTFYINMGQMGFTDKEHDVYLDESSDNPFVEFNKHVKTLFEVLKERGSRWLTNGACWKLPKYVKVKLAYISRKHHDPRIYSYDTLIFCMEEIDCLYGHLYAENIIFKLLPLLNDRIGESFDHEWNLKEVKSELEDDYYHGVGVKLIDQNNITKFVDVYSLTNWHHSWVFPSK